MFYPGVNFHWFASCLFIQGLEELHDDLVILEVLVYEVSILLWFINAI